MAAALAVKVPAPRWELIYEGVNITGEISPMVLALSYTDHVGSASGEIEVTLEDHDRRWQGAWAPSRGDLVSLRLGYDGRPLLGTGEFRIDELELEGPPDVMRIRALESFIVDPLRTRRYAAYENLSLGEIAGAIAVRHGYSVIDASSLRSGGGGAQSSEAQAQAASRPNGIGPSAESAGLGAIRFQRVTQSAESDLEFLKRLAIEHNFDFTVRGRRLVFVERSALEEREAVLTIERREVERFSFMARTHRIYRAARVSYQVAERKELISRTVTAVPAVASGDTLEIVSRAEDAQQARLRAAAELHQANRHDTVVRLRLPGTTLLVAGNNAELRGWGAMDGKYHVTRARHVIERETGYTTEADLRRV